MKVERTEQWEDNLKLCLLEQINFLAKKYFGDDVSLGGPGLPWICVLPHYDASLEDYLLSMDLQAHLFNGKKSKEGSVRMFVREYEKILALKSQGEEAYLSIN